MNKIQKFILQAIFIIVLTVAVYQLSGKLEKLSARYDKLEGKMKLIERLAKTDHQDFYGNCEQCHTVQHIKDSYHKECQDCH